MADNRDLQATPATLASGTKVALFELSTFSGDANALIAPTVPGFISGAEGARTFVEAPGDAANGLDVDVTRVIPGTGDTHLGKAEDAAHVSGSTGVMALAVRKDTAAALAGTDGDYSPFLVDALGRLHATLSAHIRAFLATKATVTLTLTSLANGSGQESTVLDFSSSGAIDALLRVVTKGQGGSTGRLDLYAYAALGDTTYTDGATGSDAAFTAANRLNSRYLGFVQMNTTNAVIAIFSLAAAFDGTLPSKVGIIAINSSGAALSATGGDHVIEVQTVVLAA